MKSAEAKSYIKKASRGEKWRTIQTIPKGAKKQPTAKSDAKPQKKKADTSALADAARGQRQMPELPPYVPEI